MKSALASSVTFARLDGVHQTFRSLDDRSVELVLTPRAGRRILLELVEVDQRRGAERELAPIPDAPEAFYGLLSPSSSGSDSATSRVQPPLHSDSVPRGRGLKHRGGAPRVSVFTPFTHTTSRFFDASPEEMP